MVIRPAQSGLCGTALQRLNVRHDYRLPLVIPCANESADKTMIFPFGSKYSLIGFDNPKVEFVTISDGKITGFYNRDAVYITVHNGRRHLSRRGPANDGRRGPTGPRDSSRPRRCSQGAAKGDRSMDSGLSR